MPASAQRLLPHERTVDDDLNARDNMHSNTTCVVSMPQVMPASAERLVPHEMTVDDDLNAAAGDDMHSCTAFVVSMPHRSCLPQLSTSCPMR